MPCSRTQHGLTRVGFDNVPVNKNLLKGFRTVLTKYFIKRSHEKKSPKELPSGNRGSSKRDTKLHGYIYLLLSRLKFYICLYESPVHEVHVEPVVI